MSVRDGIELLVARHVWVDAVQLPKTDLFDAELVPAHARFGDEVIGLSAGHPLARARSSEARFGRDENADVRMQRLADEFFGNIGSVRIRGVDEIHAQRRQAPERAQRLVAILRFPPNSGPGEAHGTEAETVDGVLPPILKVPDVLAVGTLEAAEAGIASVLSMIVSCQPV